MSENEFIRATTSADDIRFTEYRLSVVRDEATKTALTTRLTALRCADFRRRLLAHIPSNDVIGPLQFQRAA